MSSHSDHLLKQAIQFAKDVLKCVLIALLLILAAYYWHDGASKTKVHEITERVLKGTR